MQAHGIGPQNGVVPRKVEIFVLNGIPICLIHEFSRVRQPLHCPKTNIVNYTRPCFMYK